MVEEREFVWFAWVRVGGRQASKTEFQRVRIVSHLSLNWIQIEFESVSSRLHFEK